MSDTSSLIDLGNEMISKSGDIMSAIELAENADKLRKDLKKSGQVMGSGIESAINSKEAKDLANVTSKGVNLVADNVLKGFDTVTKSKEFKDIVTGISDVTNVLGDGFGKLDASYIADMGKAKKEIMAIAGIASKGCLAVLPLLRLEIFRDFSQIVSLFFANSYSDVSGLLKGAKNFFGGISNFLTFDYAAALQSPSAIRVGIFVMIIIAILLIFGYIWVYWVTNKLSSETGDKVREGHEAKSFAEVASKKKRTIQIVGLVLTGSLTVYMPITQTAFQVLFCKEDQYVLNYDKFGSCVEGNNTYLYIMYGAIIFILLFSLPLPYFLYKQIQLSKPKGSPANPDVTHDIDGIEVPFDDKIYTELIENDLSQQLNPFRSLYQGFEKHWCAYKVYMMVFKVFLIVPILYFTAQGSLKAATIFGMISLIGQTLFLTYSCPFVDPLNDYMSLSGQFTAVIAAFGGLIGSTFEKDSAIGNFVGFLVLLSGIINTFVMISITCYSFDFVKNTIKNITGRFSFFDSSRNIDGLSAVTVIEKWDLDREIKHRVWQTFWNGLLLGKCGENVAERLICLQSQTIDYGIEYIKGHWNGENDPTVVKDRAFCKDSLEGVDVYWNDATGTRDGHLDSKTYFGKMYVQNYPFHIVMVYDDAKDESFIRGEKVRQLIELNMSPEIQLKKQIRLKLRALSMSGTAINFPFSRTETETVDDGIETYKDNEGKNQTRTVKSTISIVVHYTMGIVNIASETDKIMSAGFIPTMIYRDGHGSAKKPKTGQTHNVSNRNAIMGNDHMGINDQFIMTQELSKLFQSAGDLIISQQLPLIHESNLKYRQNLKNKVEESNLILGDGFWYFVYNNHQLSRNDLITYLESKEKNPILQSVSIDHAIGLDFVYKRLAHVTISLRTKFWFIFWEDFWVQNKEMKILQGLDLIFDPSNSNAMCYTPMNRIDLEKFLNDKGLLKTCSKSYFTPSIIDAIYNNKYMSDNNSSKLNPISI